MSKAQLLAKLNNDIDQIIYKAQVNGWTDTLRAKYKKLTKLHKEIVYAK